jgi:hypothetical protein
MKTSQAEADEGFRVQRSGVSRVCVCVCVRESTTPQVEDGWPK